MVGVKCVYVRYKKKKKKKTEKFCKINTFSGPYRSATKPCRRKNPLIMYIDDGRADDVYYTSHGHEAQFVCYQRSGSMKTDPATVGMSRCTGTRITVAHLLNARGQKIARAVRKAVAVEASAPRALPCGHAGFTCKRVWVCKMPCPCVVKTNIIDQFPAPAHTSLLPLPLPPPPPPPPEQTYIAAATRVFIRPPPSLTTLPTTALTPPDNSRSSRDRHPIHRRRSRQGRRRRQRAKPSTTATAARFSQCPSSAGFVENARLQHQVFHRTKKRIFTPAKFNYYTPYDPASTTLVPFTPRQSSLFRFHPFMPNELNPCSSRLARSGYGSPPGTDELGGGNFI